MHTDTLNVIFTYSIHTAHTLCFISTLQPVYFNNFVDTNFYPIIWHNKIKNLYFNCKGEVCVSVTPFYMNVALSDDGRYCWPDLLNGTMRRFLIPICILIWQ